MVLGAGCLVLGAWCWVLGVNITLVKTTSGKQGSQLSILFCIINFSVNFAWHYLPVQSFG